MYKVFVAKTAVPPGDPNLYNVQGVCCSDCCTTWWSLLVQCTIGYNNFKNLVMQTLWWLPNKILKHIRKKRFFLFLEQFPAHLQSKFTKSANKRKNFFYKNNMGIKKGRISRWFRIRWKSFRKMHQKKLLTKTWRKYALFSLLFMFVKLVLLITFCWCIFWYLFWF